MRGTDALDLSGYRNRQAGGPTDYGPSRWALINTGCQGPGILTVDGNFTGVRTIAYHREPWLDSRCLAVHDDTV